VTTDESKTPDLDALARATIALGKRATQGPWVASFGGFNGATIEGE
jgi:hypothetical protein